MEDPDVTNDKRGKEPVDKVNNVVMIKVVHDILPLELAVIVICMHFRSDRLVKTGVEIAKEGTALLWA